MKTSAIDIRQETCKNNPHLIELQLSGILNFFCNIFLHSRRLNESYCILTKARCSGKSRTCFLKTDISLVLLLVALCFSVHPLGDEYFSLSASLLKIVLYSKVCLEKERHRSALHYQNKSICGLTMMLRFLCQKQRSICYMNAATKQMGLH